MWELLLQMRVLLPYIGQLVPLLDRGLGKSSSELSEVAKGIALMQTSSRDLEVQARNQALQLERIEQQMARLRVVHENSMEESRIHCSGVPIVPAVRVAVLSIAIVMVVLLAASGTGFRYDCVPGYAPSLDNLIAPVWPNFFQLLMLANNYLR